LDSLELLLLCLAIFLSLTHFLPPGTLWFALRSLFAPRPTLPKVPQPRQPRPLKPKSEDDCPFCRLKSAARAAQPTPTPWSKVRSARGKRKVYNTTGFACITPGCKYYGITDSRIHALIFDGRQGKNKDIRELRCNACHASFSERRGTVMYDLKTPPETVVLALTLLACGVPRSVVSSITHATDATLLRWLTRTGEHAESLHLRYFHHLRFHHLQLDELYLRLRNNPDGKWLWAAMDAATKTIPVITFGSRKLEMAYDLLHRLKPMLAEGDLPVFTTDGLKHYFYAITAHFGRWVADGKRKVWQVFPDLLYGQLKKVQRRGRLLRVERNMLLGERTNFRSRLKAADLSGLIQTAFVERLNLTLRHGVSFLARRTWGLAWHEETLMSHVQWFCCYYHFARPHLSLRHRLDTPERTPRGRTRRWRQRTPAMAAGLTDHIWSVKEIITHPVYTG